MMQLIQSNPAFITPNQKAIRVQTANIYERRASTMPLGWRGPSRGACLSGCEILQAVQKISSALRV